MTNSFCAEMLTHSPAAMLVAPAMAPASPASRTTDESTPAPAKPMTNDTLRHQPVADSEDRGARQTTGDRAVTGMRFGPTSECEATHFSNATD